MFTVAYSNQFKKDVKTLVKRGFNMDILKSALIELENTGTLQPVYKPHRLSGNYNGCWDGHLKPDWIIIWKVVDNEIQLARTGTHSDVF